MSSINSSLSNVFAITSQINALKQQGATVSKDDMEKLTLALQQNFNEMLNSLMASDNDDNDKVDIFGSYFSNSQNPFNSQITQNTDTGQSDAASAQTSTLTTSTTPAANTLGTDAQYAIFSAQNQLNLNNIF